jgi:hypothetical protein
MNPKNETSEVFKTSEVSSQERLEQQRQLYQAAQGARAFDISPRLTYNLTVHIYINGPGTLWYH